MYEDVADFHKKFGIPTAGSEPCRIPDHQVLEYRIKFLNEELEEFEEACARGSLTDMLDALVDLAWVAMGTAHYMKAPFDEAWAEVRRANNERVLVTRENCPPEKQYRRDMVMKPPGWRGPELLRVIADHNTRLKRLAEKQVVINRVLDDIGDATSVSLPPVELGKDDEPVTDGHPLGCRCAWCKPIDLAANKGT